MVLNRYVSALTLRFKSVCIGFDFALRFRNLFFVDIASSAGNFELISVFDFELEYADMNFDLVSASLALGLRSGVSSFSFKTSIWTLIWYRLHNGISKAFRSCVSNGDFSKNGEDTGARKFGFFFAFSVVINLICLFTFDFDLCIEISTTFIIMLMLIMSSMAVMMFILAFLRVW
ncbi:uncharacterized protein OCT59_014229 [Rhizophagus irregularis]|uniref:uncharacterized protein n=1 Tax=Rhizophagus irregularis TaxID=588596 RepID=UPI0033219F54|nr:hypothetical protein OCT59_014229 [Rhizophagus irregularis]